MVSCQCFSIQYSSRLIYLFFSLLVLCQKQYFIKIFKNSDQQFTQAVRNIFLLKTKVVSCQCFSIQYSSRLIYLFFSLLVLCQKQYFIKIFKNSDQQFTQAVRAAFCHRFSDLVKMLNFFITLIGMAFPILIEIFKNSDQNLTPRHD